MWVYLLEYFVILLATPPVILYLTILCLELFHKVWPWLDPWIAQAILPILLIVSCGVVPWLSFGWLRKQLLKKQILDQPNERSSHSQPVPRGAGWIFVFAIVSAILWGVVLLAFGSI
jgi:hypothetical protein